MCVDTGVAGSACEVLVLAIRDVDVCFGVPVLLGQPEVNDVNLVGLLPKACGAQQREGGAPDEPSLPEHSRRWTPVRASSHVDHVQLPMP